MNCQSSAVSGGPLAPSSPSFQQTHWDWDDLAKFCLMDEATIIKRKKWIDLTFLINLVAADHLSDAVIRIRKCHSCSSTVIYSLRGSSCDIRYDLVKQRIWSQLNTFKGVGECSTVPKFNRNAKINDPVVVLEVRNKILSRCGFIDSLKNY